MARTTGSWLSGGADQPKPSGGSSSTYRGQRLGLPAAGPGSVAGTLQRVLAITVDWVLATVIAYLFTAPTDPGYWRLPVWALVGVVAVALFSTTPGQLLVGIGVARVDAEAPVGIARSVGRVVLTALIVPAFIWDTDGRGLQDQWTTTVLLRLR